MLVYSSRFQYFSKTSDKEKCVAFQVHLIMKSEAFLEDSNFNTQPGQDFGSSQNKELNIAISQV